MNPEVDDSTLPGLDDLLLDLLAHLGDNLLDAGGVDTAVLHELVQRQTRYLAAYGVEAREDDGLRRVVDDDLYARGGLQSTDVGRHLGLLDDLIDVDLGLVLGLGAQTLDEALAGLVCGEAAELLEALLLATAELLELLLLLLVLDLLDLVLLLLELDALTL